MRLIGHSRGHVRRVLRGIARRRPVALPQDAGFRGSVRVVTEWATHRRRSEMPDAPSIQRVPSARTIARLMTIGRDTLSKSETVTIAAIEQGVPLLVEAQEIIADFHTEGSDFWRPRRSEVPLLQFD